MKQGWQGPLEKIDDYRWRIPKTYNPGMRVPGIIYADENLLKNIRADRAPEQIANVAHLLGIVKYSLAMPDIHWGYGFCLTKDTKILTNLGFYKPIKDFAKDWSYQCLRSIALNSKRPIGTSILRFIKLKPKEIFKIITKNGYEIKATEDHPLLTPSGMRPIRELSFAEKIAIFPFQGVSYVKPANRIIISEKDLRRTLLKIGRKPHTPKFELVLQKLKGRGLLSLTYNHPHLPYILKIMGFLFGDGSMNFIGKRGDGVLHFSGKPQDLEEAREDLKKIGYTSSPIHFQRRKSSRNSDKYYDCYSFTVNASSLVVLLETLGVPRGTKVNQAYRVPKWIFNAPLWQKRLFLASLFGCELRMPHRRLNRRGYFNAPVFPMAKREELIKNGKDFLKDISRLLKEFGVKILYMDKRKRHINTKGEISWALELVFSPKPENLSNLWGKIGFEYNIERSFIASVAVQYLKLKKKVLEEKEEAIKTVIPRLLNSRLSYQKIALQLAGNPLTKRFITDVCWKLNKGRKIIPRIPFNFPSFADHLEEVTKGLGKSGMVWDEIEKIEKTSYRDFVYDFTVSHTDHNFIANNFVVSNCIGGVAATDIQAGGVVSPGGVGFDINCLSATTFIFNELGYKIRIKDFAKDFSKRRLISIDFNQEKPVSTDIIGFLKQKPRARVLNILTETGRQITATEDHPFYTKEGMKELGKLSLGDELAIYPFEGVEYEEPNSEIIIDVEDVKKLLLELGKDSRGSGIEQILMYLEKKNILPLRYNSPQLPYLLKIMGYCFGDGLIYFSGKRTRGITCFYGKKEDLSQIKEDIAKIGFKGVGIYSRHRRHKIETMYSTVEFERAETWLKVASGSFSVLLAALGVPIGNKCRKPYDVPQWLFKAPLWQKRLFLASLFGAELSSPKTMTGHGYNFYCPTLSMNKTQECLENGREFLAGISKLLSEFGVFTHQISQRKEYINTQGIVSYRLRLTVSGKTKNLLSLYGKVGFEYNQERKFLANVAVQYLKVKEKIIDEKKEVAALAPNLYNSGKWDREQLYDYLSASPYESRVTAPRMWGDDPTFEEFLQKATAGLGRSGMVWERIESIDDLPDYDDYVYDFTVKHADHNFIANNFVVSNCGVRLVRTNLTEKDVKTKMRDLVYALFNNIPAGVGSKGEIRISSQEERKLLVKGAKWAVERGYGGPEDLEYTEERGAIAGADPQTVSSRAYERGQKQAGTLGSGNHFLEVQVIDQIYDEQAAGVFNLHPGQVTVMIHTGSRGFGYQICDDYAKGMVRILGKYGIRVPDRQLACAPVNSAEGKAYLGAMRCAANYAWCNRQVLMELTRRIFQKFFKLSPKDLGMELIYDVAHNIAKIEKHLVDGEEKTLCVHRKGATRAFPPGHPELPEKYKSVGQPVIIPGDMGRNSYLLVGTEKAAETFYSTCFTGDTKILTNKGIISLKEVDQFFRMGLEFKVASLNKKDLSIEWKRILEVHKREAEVIRVAVSQTNKSRFSILDTTPDHKFGIFENAEIKFMNIEKIINEHKMLCILDQLNISWRLYSPQLAFLVGALATDGYIEKGRKITFTQKKDYKKEDFINYVRICFHAMFGYPLKEGLTKCGGGLIRGKYMVGTATDFVCGGKNIVGELGRIFEDLQSWVLMLDRESTLNFLAGIIDGDGTWNPNRGSLHIFNSNTELVAAIVLACLKLKILPYISIQRNNCFIIQISEKLEEILRFTKRIKGTARRQKYGSKLFSVRQLFTENWSSANIKWPFSFKADRNSLMEGEKILKFLKGNSSARYNKARIIGVINSPLRMHRVKKMENLGVKEVFNLNVQDNHNYFVFTKTFVPILVKNCHGSGRCLSRSAAIRSLKGRSIAKELEQKGIFVCSAGRETLAEEAPEAYKDVNAVVYVVHQAGISKRVCRMRPLGVVKG